jgi:hypothetical protein
MCKGSEKARTSLLMGEDFSICFFPFSHFVNPPLCFALTFHCVNVMLNIHHPSLPPSLSTLSFKYYFHEKQTTFFFF